MQEKFIVYNMQMLVNVVAKWFRELDLKSGRS